VKQTIILVLVVLSLLGCQKNDSSTNNKPETSNETTIIGLTGTAAIEGRIGYFSPSLPPPNSDHTFSYPSGYQLGEYHWIAIDTPKVASRIYLDGDYGQFKNRYVQIKGSWKEIIKIKDNDEYRYLIITVDSLREIE
jgi:hypothetical protein